MSPTDRVDEEKRSTLRRFAALGAAAPLTGFADTADANADTGESEARDAIAGYLSMTPGAHFSKIRDDLQLGTGETQHHLRRLEELEVIESYRDGDYKRYVSAGQFETFEKNALGYLRRETPRGMLVSLLADPSVGASELAGQLEVSPPTVSKYARELEDAGLLCRDDGYAVEQPETLLVLLIRYADSFDGQTTALAQDADSLITYTV